MSWLQTIGFALPPPDPRPTRLIEQEILDELEFHIEMRTLEGVSAGMPADEARQDALRRFGDFQRIRKKCRQTLLGERIMLQRIQALLTLVLLGAVVFLAVEFYRGQRANQAATMIMMRTLERIASQRPSAVVTTAARTEDSKKQQPGVPRPEDRPKVISVSPAPDATGVDPVTEIRIRFDRDMDPNKMGLHAEPINAGTPFRLHGSPKYLAERKEFVVPVILKPGAKYDLSLVDSPSIGEKVSDFRSINGMPAAAYSWRFATRDAPANPNAPRPRVVSVDPPSGAQTGMVVAIRVRFDRPMNPEAFEPVCSIPDEGMQWENASVPFPVEYDAPSHSFTFQTLFPRSSSPRIELRGFRGADGGQAEPMTIKYEVGKKLYLPEQEARITEAGRSAKLRELVDGIRRKRLAMKSLEETVRTVSSGSNRKGHLGWSDSLEVKYARFGFQGDRQFYADVSSIMEFSPSTLIPPNVFRLGSDGRECWFLQISNHSEGKLGRNLSSKRMLYCPFDAMREQTVIIGDPFGSKRVASAEEAIQRMKLEYVGDVARDGKTYHRVRSWVGNVFMNHADAIRDWLIDTRSLLPAVCENSFQRCEFSYARINEPIAEETFQMPAAADVPREPFKLEEGYDHFLLKACDGSDGRMSARWGQQGKKGTSSSGLN